MELHKKVCKKNLPRKAARNEKECCKKDCKELSKNDARKARKELSSKVCQKCGKEVIRTVCRKGAWNYARKYKREA